MFVYIKQLFVSLSAQASNKYITKKEATGNKLYMISEKHKEVILETLGKHPYKKLHDYFIARNVILRGKNVVSSNYIRYVVLGERSNALVEEYIYKAVKSYQTKLHRRKISREKIIKKLTK